MNRQRRSSSFVRGAGGLAAIGLLALSAAACSDDDGDGQSAQEQYCDAGASLRSSVDELLDLDVVAEGTNGVKSAAEAVEGDLQELRDSATDAAEGDVDALDDAVSGLDDALSAAGDDLTAENATAVVNAISGVVTAAEGVYATLSDC